LVRTLAPKEVPLLNWIGDSNRFATNTKHEFIEDFMLPNYIVASTAIGSATAVTAFQVNGLGNALNVGQLLQNESAAPELMQVVSIVGPNSIAVSRAFDGGTIGSLAAGGQLYVRGAAGVEGADHSGADTRRLGNPRANTVGVFRMELAQSKTQQALAQVGNDSWDARISKGLIDAMHQLEKEVIRGVLNGTNSLGTSSTTRTMQGIRAQILTINSTITSNSFVANPHLYIGNLWESAFGNGATVETETWGIIAGSTWFKALSDLNDSKVEDTNQSEVFQRRVRRYVGPFGQADMFLSRVMPAQSLLLVPRERLQVVPLQGRSFDYTDMAVSGDNQKGLITGEYTLELYHESGMAQAHS
jgi:hypothetical protein